MTPQATRRIISKQSTWGSEYYLQIYVLFQYNAWAIPCSGNDVVECDKNEDEIHCNPPNWPNLVGILTLLLIFLIVFIGYIKLQLRGMEKKEYFDIQPSISANEILAKEKRGQLALQLDEGGKDEAKKVYQGLKNEENELLLLLKVHTYII